MVTEALTKEHKKRHHCQEKPPVTKYKVGDAAWRECPSKLSEHQQATYYVSAEAQKRLGEDTYTLKVGERLYRDRHHSQVKLRILDPRGKHVPLNYADLEMDEDNPSRVQHPDCRGVPPGPGSARGLQVQDAMVKRYPGPCGSDSEYPSCLSLMAILRPSCGDTFSPVLWETKWDRCRLLPP